MNTAAPDLNHCGTCTMCCKLMAVVELNKPKDEWCGYCAVGVGCTEYERRPSSCSNFECVWLQSQKRRHGELAMTPEMRPDRSKVVIDIRTDASGLVFHVDPARPTAHTIGAAGRLVDSLLAQGQELIVVCGDKRSMLRGARR